MTAALVVRVRHTKEMGKACCDYLPRANADALVTAGKVIAALALPVKARPVAAPRIEKMRGLEVVRYAFELTVPGRSWAGSGEAQDAELVNPANWRES